MSFNRQWLDQGLADLPAAQAQRIRLFRLLLGSAAAVRSEMDRALAPTGITTQQAALLQAIEAQPQPPSLGQLASALHMTHQNAKQIASALERKGFLRIEVDPQDRRARRLVLTEHHHRFWQARNPDDFDGVARWTAALQDDQVTELVALLGTLVKGLRAPVVDQGPA